MNDVNEKLDLLLIGSFSWTLGESETKDFAPTMLAVCIECTLNGCLDTAYKLRRSSLLKLLPARSEVYLSLDNMNTHETI